MENNNNHQITLPKGRIGFSSLDVSDNDEPKYQIRDPYELTKTIFPTNEQYKDFFLLHATIPSQSHDEFYAEDEIDRYSEEFHLNEGKLETDFTSNDKSCQPVCDE